MTAVSSKILFEKFEIIDCLKKDDFSSVYLANHIYLNKKIVLKILDKNQITDESIIERFKREAKLLAQLDHPNIIKVLDFGFHENHLYISFEYFESNNLRHHINKRSYNEQQIKKLLKQILTALEFAHNNKIIHRDIKPENIFVNDDHVLKIGDFGLAFAKGDKFVTQKASVVGTPAYMSPEQIQGEELDETSDLFSTGAVFYELITGRSLFMAGDLNLTLNKILNFDAYDVKNNLSCEDKELIDAVYKILQYDRSERPPGALKTLELLGVGKEELANIQLSATRVRKSKGVKYSYLFLAVFLAAAIIVIYEYGFNRAEDIAIPETSVNDSSNEQPLNTELSGDMANESLPGTNEAIKQVEDLVDPVTLKNKEQTNSQGENNTVTPEIISYGALSLKITPWANVYIDSKFIDSTPIDSNIRLTAGLHEIILKNPGYPDYVSQVVIPANDALNLSFSLDTLFSYLTVNVFPWGNVSINNVEIGDTPLENIITLNSGKHELKIRNPELGVFQKEIELKKGDTANVSFNFSGQKFVLK